MFQDHGEHRERTRHDEVKLSGRHSVLLSFWGCQATSEDTVKTCRACKILCYYVNNNKCFQWYILQYEKKSITYHQIHNFGYYKKVYALLTNQNPPPTFTTVGSALHFCLHVCDSDISMDKCGENRWIGIWEKNNMFLNKLNRWTCNM